MTLELMFRGEAELSVPPTRSSMQQMCRLETVASGTLLFQIQCVCVCECVSTVSVSSSA